MTKQQIINDIQKVYQTSRGYENLLTNKIEIGEYAFPDDYEYFYDDLKDNIEALELSEIEGVSFNQPCSKSGVIVTVEHGYNEDELYTITDNCDNAKIEMTTKELSELKKESKLEYKRVSKLVETLKEQVSKVIAEIEAVAVGKRCACFSNGEVVFSPLNKEVTGYNQVFTPYYNPNV